MEDKNLMPTTCDQYVLNELRDCKEELSLAKSKLEETQKKLDTHSMEKMIGIDQTIGTIYYVRHQSDYYYKKDLPIDTLKKLLVDDDLLDKCQVSDDHYDDKAYSVDEILYQLRVAYMGRTVFIHFYKTSGDKLDESVYHSDSCDVFSSYAEAVAYGRKAARSIISEIIIKREKTEIKGENK